MKLVTYVALGAILLMTGCAQKVQVKALNPAEIGEMASKKKVAVTSFKNDELGLSAKIEAEIAKHMLDDQKYFTVLSRNDVDKVIQEQKLQSSVLIDEKTATKIGKLVGAQAIINGQVSSSGKEDKYLADRQRCAAYDKKKCVRYENYRVTCNTTVADVSASINIVDMETGSIIYADTITKNYNGDSCSNGEALALVANLFGGGAKADATSGKLLSATQAQQKLANDITKEFVHKLTPNYVYFEVTLLESIEFEVSKAQQASFTGALEYIKSGRMDKAEGILAKLHDELNGKSYVLAYDLGVVKEAQGDFLASKKMYAMADELTTQPVNEINEAVLRIYSLIEKNEKAKAQISRK
jgi:curli biogenesis system outer membrane secretion channel CsgG